MWIRACALLLFVWTVGGATYNPPADRLHNWAAYAGVKGGKPDITSVYTTLGTTTTVSQFNAHVDSAGTNKVIQFDAGTFEFASSLNIDQSGLRFVGSTNANGFPTTIFKMNGAGLYGVVHVNGSSFNDPNDVEPPNIVNWTNGYALGESNIMLSSVSGLTVGKFLKLDQDNDELLASDFASEGNSAAGRLNGDRAQIHTCEVMAINGNTVTIWPPLYMTNWVSSRTPQAYWLDGQPVQRVIFENIRFTNNVNSDFFIVFMHARDIWFENCESWNAGDTDIGMHLRTYYADRITVINSWFQKSKTAASQTYGLNPYWCSAMWAVNNVFADITSPITLEHCSGSVFAYNFGTNLVYSDPTWLIPGMVTHGAHASMNIFEGNHFPNWYMDFIHGSGSHNFGFRNRIVGWETGRDVNTYAIAMQRFQRNNTVVGNLLGKLGFHNRYEKGTDGGHTNNQEYIYAMGFYDTGESYTNQYDAEVTNSVIRHMNYDVSTTTNNGVRYQFGVSDYGLTNSYLYSSKPSWFGFLNWPPYDPSLTNSSGIDPTNIPAGYRFWFGTNPPAGAGGGGGGSEHKPRARHNAASSRWR